MGISKKIDLKNIKKAATGGYQIQFIVNGKSHSGFAKELPDAIKIRDKLRKELKVIPNGAFKKRSQQKKQSLIPGTKKVMAVGITSTTFQSRGTETYYILVNWKDITGKNRTKGFYVGKESTYTLKKEKQVYKRALEFRKAYEKAVLDENLDAFCAAVATPKKTKSSKQAKLMNKNRLLRNKRIRRRR